MNPQPFSDGALQQALQEAAQRLSTGGLRVTPDQVERALVQTLHLRHSRELLETSWTPDIIIHHVLDYDFSASGDA